MLVAPNISGDGALSAHSSSSSLLPRSWLRILFWVPPRGYPFLSYLFLVVYDFKCLQNSHLKGVTGKILHSKGLCLGWSIKVKNLDVIEAFSVL
jgi:hypothetical protein